MRLFNVIKNFFKRRGATFSMGNSLSLITDDQRIATDQDEIDRIRLAQLYYAGSYSAQKGMPVNTIKYFNSQGTEKVRNFNAVNITQMVSKREASICLNNGFNVSVASRSDPNGNGSGSIIDLVAQFIDDWLEKSGVNRNLEAKLEQGIPVGGFAARPYVDGDEIKIAWIRADQFFSLDSNTEEISQAAISNKSVKVVNNQRYYYTLLEFHQWNNGEYQITNELYKSIDSKTVGEQVSLGTDDMYSDITPEVSFTGFKQPLFAYFKVPGQNNIAPESPLGIGFVNNTQNILDAINYAHDSFVWEIRVGRRKVLVPAEAMKPGDEEHPGAKFDPDDDTYLGINTGLDDNFQITPINPDIRVDDYQQTMQYFLHELENAVGLSSGTFTTDAQGGITTATQVVSENSMTYQTRSSYLNRVSKFLSDLIVAVLQLAQAPEAFDSGEALLSGIDVDNIQFNIHYDDGVFVDKDAQAKQDMLAVTSGVMPKKQFLMRNYGLSEEDANEWLAEVTAEAPEIPINEAPGESDMLNGGDE